MANEEFNPFAAPVEVEAERVEVFGDDFRPTKIDVLSVFTQTWGVFKKKWVGCLWGVFVLYIAALVPEILVEIVLQGLHAGGDQDAAQVASIASRPLLWVLQSCLQLGYTIYLLQLCRDRERINQLLQGGPYLLRFIGATVLFASMVFAGLLLFIIPGFIVMLMFFPYMYVLVDQNTGVMDSLYTAREITTGNKLSIFAIGVAAFGLFVLVFISVGIMVVMLAGAVNPAHLYAGVFFGIVVVLGFFTYLALLASVLYLSMTGRRTIAD